MLILVGRRHPWSLLCRDPNIHMSLDTYLNISLGVAAAGVLLSCLRVVLILYLYICNG